MRAFHTREWFRSSLVTGRRVMVPRSFSDPVMRGRDSMMVGGVGFFWEKVKAWAREVTISPSVQALREPPGSSSL